MRRTALHNNAKMCPPIGVGDEWPELHRARRAIVVIDVVESVRLLVLDEADAIDRWRRFVNEVRTEVLAVHGGRLVKSLGDGMLIECEQAPRAVALAFEVQRRIARRNQGIAEDRRILLRIGLHACDVVADEFDVYGAGVNLAARIAGLARPAGIAASEDIADALLPGVDVQLEDGGRCYLKHIDEPVQVYHLQPCAAPGPAAGADRRSDSGATGQIEHPLATCIALVPIAWSDGDVPQRTLTELLGDMLLTRLSTVPLLRVISRLSTEQFRARGLDGPQIAALSGASYLVAGRLHGQGRRCVVYLELIECHGEALVWATSAHFDAADLLDPGENVTPALVQAIVDQIVAHQLRRVAVSPLPTLASQTLQFSAIHLMHRRAPSDFDRANEVLQHLVERHPRADAPHAWLAQWHVLRITKGLSAATDDEAARALDHTHRALDLNPESAMTRAMEAFVLCHLRRDLAAARAQVEQALDLNPNEPWAWLVRATVEGLLGHGERAWASARRAADLSPLDPLKHYFDSLAASAAVSAERYGDAERLARLALSKDARHLPTLRALAIAQVHLGLLPAARETVARVMQLLPDFSLARYVGEAPRGSEPMRQRWADALREAGAPD